MRCRGAVGAVLAIALAGVIAFAPSVQAAGHDPGSNGECGQRSWSFRNPRRIFNHVWVYEPTGDSDAATGGRCDDAKRPAVFLAHGYSAITPTLYQDMINHFTSRGHVVVFANYSVIWSPGWQYRLVEAGFRHAMSRADRIDAANVGIVGHSFGGGMVPWLAQQADRHGWGTDSMWLVAMSPHFANLVGSGPIALPEHARLLVMNFAKDNFVDNRVGVEMHQSADLPSDQKQHFTIASGVFDGVWIESNHLSPNTIPFVAGSDALDREAIWASIDSLATCASTGEGCDDDYSAYGAWTDSPVDSGPTSVFGECTFFINPRPCP